MFEGVSDQLHQFISPRTSSLPLNFTLNSSLNYTFHPFDSFNAPLPPHILPPLHHHKASDPKPDDGGANLQAAMDLEQTHDHQWSNEEVLALLRIRSNMENWFPESTWEHVSRKLGEVGFRRTAEKCKEKFEEESRFFNHINYTKTSTENHHLYQDHQPAAAALFHGGNVEKEDHDEEPEEEEEKKRQFNDEESKIAKGVDKMKKKMKRKLIRQKEFERLKAFCEDIVKKMMAQQEEIHTKLLHDMLKREEEKVAKEECWKKQQMERLHKELEIMAQEQAIAGDRQATIIDILTQITNSTNDFPSLEAKRELKNLLQTLNATSPSSSSLVQPQTSSPNSEYDKNKQQSLMVYENSSSFTSQNDPKNPNDPIKTTPKNYPVSVSIQNPKPIDQYHDLGKRWPRDEVLALVNVRCSLYGNGGEQLSEGGEGSSSRAPLWERISQGMMELGYKRSAKRCKEKWENINKYFRKTRDVNKKRSLDSRTCPYFHQLNTLYNQGGSNVVASTTIKRAENWSENRPNSACRISSANTANAC